MATEVSTQKHIGTVNFINWNGRESTAGEYRGLDRNSAYLSGMYRIGMVVQLIKRKGFERRRRNRSQWTGDDQNRFESRVVDLKATERFNLLNGK